MDTNDKLQWIRENWSKLKEKGLLKAVIRQKILNSDDWLRDNYSASDIIAIEESFPEYLK